MWYTQIYYHSKLFANVTSLSSYWLSCMAVRLGVWAYLATGPVFVWEGCGKVIKRDDLEQVEECFWGDVLTDATMFEGELSSFSRWNIMRSYCPCLYVKWTVNENDADCRESRNTESELSEWRTTEGNQAGPHLLPLTWQPNARLRGSKYPPWKP